MRKHFRGVSSHFRKWTNCYKSYSMLIIHFKWANFWLFYQKDSLIESNQTKFETFCFQTSQIGRNLDWISVFHFTCSSILAIGHWLLHWNTDKSCKKIYKCFIWQVNELKCEFLWYLSFSVSSDTEFFFVADWNVPFLMKIFILNHISFLLRIFWIFHSWTTKRNSPLSFEWATCEAK